MTVFRAITENVPLRQTPQSWVRNQQSFPPLAEAPVPEKAAELHAAGVPHVEKVWTELAFENVRLERASHLPSRLESLFAFADPLEAFDFGYETFGMKQAWVGEVPENVRWAQVDMSAYRVERAGTATSTEFQVAWDRAVVRASSYWVPSGIPVVAEVLVEGPIQLLRRVTLVQLFRDLRIVE